MRSCTIFAALALTLAVSAAPAPAGAPGLAPVIETRHVIVRREGPVFPAPEDLTIAQANDICGKEMDINCCNEVTESESGDSGLLGLTGLLGGLSLFGQCSNLNLPIVNVVPVQDFLNSKCKQNAVCCQKQGQSQNGLVNLGIQCVPLTNLLT